MKHDHSKSHNFVELPTPTAWPIVTAFGLTLFFAAFVTHVVFAVVGVLVGLIGAVGWCLDLFPHPKHEPVPIRPPTEHPEPIRTTGRMVQVLEVGQKSHRARIPVEVHPYTAGAFGGLVGAVAMAALACVYGIFKYGSIGTYQPPGRGGSSLAGRGEFGNSPELQSLRPGRRHDRTYLHLDSCRAPLCCSPAHAAGSL